MKSSQTCKPNYVHPSLHARWSSFLETIRKEQQWYAKRIIPFYMQKWIRNLLQQNVKPLYKALIALTITKKEKYAAYFTKIATDSRLNNTTKLPNRKVILDFSVYPPTLINSSRSTNFSLIMIGIKVAVQIFCMMSVFSVQNLNN
ncbi:hypothetical protein GQX74_014266 [Glossina fuscipes]|nr:hypothetical protein GQX74_014266 [Glossina fuscipes]